MEYKCDYCNKVYSSRQSRWNHIKKYHSDTCNPNVIQSNPVCNPKVIQNGLQENTEEYKCKYCNKSFKFRQGKWKHEKKCTDKKTDIKLDKLEKQNDKLESELNELKLLLQRALKIHPKTLQKINHQLNAGPVVNGNVTNTYNIVPLGKENLSELLSDKEKLSILNKKYNSINELINKIHILPDDKYRQFKNAYITNLQNDIAYEYDLKSKQFLAVDKNNLLEKLIDKRMTDIETFACELDEKNNLPPELAPIIDKFIEQMWTDDSELKQKKIKQVKLLLYNNKDNIRNQLKDDFIEIEL